MTFAVAPFYAGLLGLMLPVLSLRVVRLRRRLQVGLGDGGDDALLRAMRVQGNFIEYAPLGLLLIFAVEALAYPAWLVHLLGIALVAGRVAHAVGLNRSAGASAGRVAGMVLTLNAIIAAAALCLIGAVWRWLA
ncbi:MAG: MAPEG family protein [Alphaproteobacteria bacterium]